MPLLKSTGWQIVMKCVYLPFSSTNAMPRKKEVGPRVVMEVWAWCVAPGWRVSSVVRASVDTEISPIRWVKERITIDCEDNAGLPGGLLKES